MGKVSLPSSSRVGFLEPSSDQHVPSGDNNDDGRESKRRQIREHRQTTTQAPEFMRACRRTRLRLGHGEHARAEILSVDHPLDLQCLEARAAFYRHLSTLDRPEDEEAYYAACKKKIRLITTHANDGGWYCQNIGQSTGEENAIQKERCLVVNKKGAARCTYCHAPKPANRIGPFFAKLSRLSVATKKQRDESLQRIHEYDSELARSESALAVARSKLERMQRHRAESSDDEPIPEDLTVMDVDLAQRGVRQRVDVRSLIPMLVSNQHRSRTQLSEIRGELCVLVQALYGLAAPHVQKVVRGHLLRIRLDEIRRQVMGRSRSAAATEIQRLARSLLGRRVAGRRRRRRRWDMAIRIQCLARGMLAQQERRRRYERYLDEIHRVMATRIQGLFRSRLAKLTAMALAEEERRRLQELERAREAAAGRISSTLIQCCVRRFLARRRVDQRRIELSLHDRLLRFVDRLMIDGDVWSFLKGINDDYRRYEAIVDGILEREDTMASTFVSKVVTLRRQEYELAWDQYETLTQSDEIAGDQVLSPLKRAAKTGGVVSTPGKGEQSLPNASRYHMYKSRHETNKQCAAIGRHGKNRPETSRHQPIKHPRGHYHDEAQSFNSIHACPESCTPATPLHKTTWESDWFDEMERAGFTFNAASNFPGGMLLREIPDLLDDTIKRLFYAASIRCHVPSLMDAETTPQEAHEHFLEAAPALEKARQESESKEAVDPITDQLRQMGFTYIKDVMSRQNLASLLENLTLPVTKVFISTCLDILATLEEASRRKCLSRKNMAETVSSFKQQQRSLSNHGPFTDASSTRASCSSNNETEPRSNSTVENIPGGLWSTESALSAELAEEALAMVSGSARDPIQGSPYKSRRCRRTMNESVDDSCSGVKSSSLPIQDSGMQPSAEVEVVDESVEDKSVVSSPEILLAQSEFQKKLDDLVSSALTNVDKEKKAELVKEENEKTPQCSDAFETYEDGLFRNAMRKSRRKEAFVDHIQRMPKEGKRMETRRRRHRSWAVRYTTRVLNEFEQSHPAYRNFRRGAHLATANPYLTPQASIEKKTEIVPKDVMECIESIRAKAASRTSRGGCG